MKITAQSEAVKFLSTFPVYYRGGVCEFYLENACGDLTYDQIRAVKNEFYGILNRLSEPNPEKFLEDAGLTGYSVKTYVSSIELIIYTMEINSRHAKR